MFTIIIKSHNKLHYKKNKDVFELRELNVKTLHSLHSAQFSRDYMLRGETQSYDLTRAGK